MSELSLHPEECVCDDHTVLRNMRAEIKRLKAIIESLRAERKMKGEILWLGQENPPIQVERTARNGMKLTVPGFELCAEIDGQHWVGGPAIHLGVSESWRTVFHQEEMTYGACCESEWHMAHMAPSADGKSARSARQP